VQSNQAQAKWTAAGFTGVVTQDPAGPPFYTITSQSLTAGTEVSCTSGITVSGTP
jgi:hypothetical protein